MKTELTKIFLLLPDVDELLIFLHKIKLNMNLKTLLLASVSGLALISCSPTLKVKQLDEKTGQLPTETKIMPNEVLAEKSINLNEYNQFLFIKKSGVNMEKYESYVTETLKNIGGFKKIYTQAELEQYVIQNNLTDKVTSISDNIGLLNLQKQVGNFLVCESNVEFLGGYNYQFTFKITNPATTETVLDIKHQAFNWGGLDRPLFNPVFNYYIDWTKKNTK